jgi:hypothetical protein
MEERILPLCDVTSTTLEGNKREFYIALSDQALKDIAASEAIAASA